MSEKGFSRRALFGLGLNRLRAEIPDAPPPRRRPPAPPPPGETDVDLHAISLEPVVAVAERFPPEPGEQVLVTRGGALEDCFSDHEGLFAVAEPAEVEDLPFEDDEFDRVLVPFAHVYAPDPRAALAELFRVVRPGGLVVVVTWTRERAVGRVLQAAAGWEPDVDPRLDWGDEPFLRMELTSYADEVEIDRVELDQAWSDPAAAVEALELGLPPVARALAAHPGADANALRAHAARLVAEEGEGVLTGAFLIAHARRRT